MKKSVKRLLCSTLAVLMSSTLVVEAGLRLHDDEVSGESVRTGESASVSFKNVTGQFDTSKLMEENFNSSVLKSEDVAPKYETRTVMVTLSEKPLVTRAKQEPVNEYLGTWDANRAVNAIEKEQRDFLSALKKKGIAYKLDRTYDTVLNGVAIEIDTKYVSQIKKMDGVKSVVITTAYAEPETAESYSASGVVTNQTEVYATGIYDSSKYAKEYGEGTVVAVLDTGLDYTHRAFQRFESDDVDVAWDKDYVLAKLNDTGFELSAEKRSGTLSVNEVYLSEKVPFAYDYADDDADVYPSYSNHGTHVAGIIGGYDTAGYTDKDGNPVDEVFKGVVPDAQLVICKVFTDDLDDKDLGGAVSEDIIAALDDCVKLGVDVINMSLGTSCGFTTTDDGDDEGEMLNEVYERITGSGISLICAASNDYSAGYGGVYGTNLATNPDSGTVGSPSTYASALSVASINGQKADYMLANEGTESEAYVFYEESRDINSKPFDFYKSLTEKYNTNEFEYVVVPGVGHASNYASIKNLFQGKNRIALVKRGDTTFKEKIEVAMEMGAIGIIVYNNVSGVIRMNLGEIEDPIPAVSATLNAGLALTNGAKNLIGKIKISQDYKAGPFMSEFSSWGPTHDLRLKPEITAHGGEITSTVPGGYGEQSGTSMATPNMAGFMALVRSYIKNDLGITDAKEINRLAMQLTMSTAGTVYDQDGKPYSPRKQGAGVAKLENVIGGTDAYLWTDNAENDYRPKYELFDDPEREGEYEITFKLTNFGTETLTFNLSHITMTETLSNDKLTVAEQTTLLEETSATWYFDGSKVSDAQPTISVGADQTRTITVVLRLGDKDKQYIETSFKNGMYVEGFVKLASATDGQCDLSLPFLGFYGDWDDAPMLDYTAFEVAENAQDASVKDEDKIKASVWETLPYNSYYNETYILPMGGYVYLLPEYDEPMYVDEEHCSVSRYNEYYGEGNTENYLTSTQIKAVYAGLLRNARVVKYSLYNVETGEALITDEVLYRISKAYTGGGAGVPANVEINLSPEAEGLVANGKYEMKFEFFKDEPEAGERASEENTYRFSFTVDYEAPILEDVRVRFYNYKENDKEKQRVYLDVDVFDNHYAQALMLCYPKTQILDGKEQVVLQLATDYPTPIRKANKNGTTTVSIDVTDIYDSYINSGNTMYIQVDDYAVNSCLYELNITEANKDLLPDDSQFELAKGEDEITLDIYQTHKVSLVYADSYKGNADLSNFNWTSQNKEYVQVKNGEIVGLKSTKDCKGGYVKVLMTGKTGAPKEIKVFVTENVATGLPEIPTISLGVIKNSLDALQKAQGSVKVMAGKTIELGLEAEPWYHPMASAMTQADYMEQKGIRLVWSSKKEQVATVDQDGVVQTLKKGVATISVSVEKKNAKGVWEQTIYGASITLNVQNEFTVSNYTLTDYNGVGGTVVIPDDMNIMYIGTEAFKDNDNIKKIIIPASVVDINERAFYNCTALEEVYFVSEEHREDGNGNIINPQIDWSDLSMVYENVFTGCINLRKVDLSNVKTVTIAQDCFSGCVSLSEVVDMPSIGTMHHRAFAGTALTSVDLTGLHMSGTNVFDGCTSLTSVTTGKFTAIGTNMFKNCTALEEIVLATPKIGAYAFNGCVNLKEVKFQSPEGESLRFDIGANAFAFCGINAGELTIDFGGEHIGSIGERAFANSALKTLDFSTMQGLTVLGGEILSGTTIKNVVISDGIDFESIDLSGAPFKGMTVSVEPKTMKYQEANGVIYDAGMNKILFVNEAVVGNFVLPSTISEIGDYAFAHTNITQLTATANLRKIGEYAFYNSAITTFNFAGANLTEIPVGAFRKSALSEITLPESVKTVGAYAFAESVLTSFSAMGLDSVGDYAFSNCSLLSTVSVNDSLKKFGDGVFQSCTSLKGIALPGLEEIGRDTFYGASNLKTVVFSENAKTTGSGTFQGTPVDTVQFNGNLITKISGGAFYGCRQLRSITLPDSVTEIEERAFEGCTGLKTINLDNVQIIGDQAFYRAGLTGSLALDSATYIGRMAFATQASANENMLGQAQVLVSLTQTNGGNTKTAFTSLSMPMVQELGEFAFLNNGLQSVELPATLVKIGQGAFASSNSLTEFKVNEASENFFVENGVLYRYIDKTAKEYELVAYPTARAESQDQYKILDGTVRVEGYAFFELNEGAVKEIVLPYSINTIGDCAFYASGVTKYIFESIQAPVLETVYRSDVETQIENASNVAYYKGYYYCNFETYLFNFTHYVKQTSKLTMQYPANGKGYDNHIYTTYFGNRIVGDVLMTDETRICVDFIEEMPDAEEVKGWMAWEINEENKAKVQAFSTSLIEVRVHYNNALNSAEQSQFITEEITEKLLAVEKELRAVKARFSVPVSVKEIKVSADSTHKTAYKAGDTFDKTGLKITVVYDDYSTEEATESEITVKSATISAYRNYVEIECRGLRLRIGIEIIRDTASDSTSDSTSDSVSDTTSDKQGGCGSVIGGASLGLTALAIGVACLLKKKEN